MWSAATLAATVSCELVRSTLARIGLLLLQHKELPNVVTLITGEHLSTSWWSHKQSQEIFACLESLDDVALATRLIGGRVTFVDRKLWPALVAAGTSMRVPKALSKKEKQERLLVVAHEVHTPSGKHELQIEPWKDWAERAGVKPLDSAAKARAVLEEAALELGAPVRLLPWHRF